MPPALSSWTVVFATQELMYRCELHTSGSGFALLIIFNGASHTDKSVYTKILASAVSLW